MWTKAELFGGKVTGPLAMALPPIFLLEDEYERLADLVCASERATPGLALLWRELQRARIVPYGADSGDVVHLGSRVRVEGGPGLPTSGGLIVTPVEFALGRGISVDSMMGASLIGLRVGDRFPWRAPGGRTGWLQVCSTRVGRLEASRRDHARLLERRQLLDELLCRK